MSVAECRWTEDDILAWVYGDLEEGRDLILARHLAACPPCREQATEYRALRRELDACEPGEAIRWHLFPTPFGRMYAAATAGGLARISWRQPAEDAWVGALRKDFPDRPALRDPDALAPVERQLSEYFAGRRRRFDLPVDLGRLTSFQRRVLEEARGIPYGHVIPYAELARRIGRPGAARAVGNALGRNPVGIVVPCHRIVRSDGGLGGYTGGVEYKERLLSLEGVDG